MWSEAAAFASTPVFARRERDLVTIDTAGW